MKASEILTSIINSLGLTPEEFNRSLHQSPRSERVRNVLSGKTANISPGLADTIHKYHPQFSIHYILTGLGDMYVAGYTAEPIPLSQAVTSQKSIYLPEYITDCLCYAYRINPKRIAEACNFDRSYFSNLTNPDVSPKSISSIKARCIIANLDHALSPSWLMYGTGPMYSDGRPDCIHPKYLQITINPNTPPTTEPQGTTEVINALRDEIKAQNQKIDHLTHLLQSYTLPEDEEPHQAAEPTQD